MQLNETQSFAAWGTAAEQEKRVVESRLPGLVVGGKRVSLEDITRVSLFQAAVTVDPAALQGAEKGSVSREALESPLHQPGRSLLPASVCRAALFQLVLRWLQGRSAVRSSAVEFLVNVLNAGCVPLFSSLPQVPVELLLFFEGKYDKCNSGDGSVKTAALSLKDFGLFPFRLNNNEKYSILKEEYAFTGMAGFLCGYANRAFRVLDVLASFSCEAAGVYLGESFDPVVFEVQRPQRGQMTSAGNMKLMLENSKNIPEVSGNSAAELVFQSIPQVHGPALETSASSSRSLEIEVNSSPLECSTNTSQSFSALQAMVTSIHMVTELAVSRIKSLSPSPIKISEPFNQAIECETTLVVACHHELKRLFSILGTELFTASLTIKVEGPKVASMSLEDEAALEKAREVMRAKGMTEEQIAKADKKRKEKAEKAAAKGKKAQKDGQIDKNSGLGVGSMRLRDLIVQYKLNESLLRCQDAIDDKNSVLEESFSAFCENLLSSLDSSSGKRKPKIPKGARDFLPEQMRIREQAFAAIRRVFKRHGAVEIDTPVFELKEVLTGKYGEDSKLIYDLADQGGELLSLRYDLTVPFARFLAMNSVGNIKRYHMAKVYRRDNPQITKGRYREFYQCDFDVAGNFPPMVADAEVITVAHEILSELPIGGFMIKLNHRGILDAIFEISGVPSEKFRTICSAVDKLDKATWEEVKAEMVDEKGLDPAVADKIGKFVTFNGEPRKLWQEMMDQKVFGDHAGALSAMSSMKTLFDFLEAMGSIGSISFDMSLARGLDYYTGVIYEAVLTDGTSSMGSIAAGGRYDNLVGMFSVSNTQTPCVGVSIGIERVFRIMEEKSQERNILQKQSTIEVYIASIGSGLLVERMKLAKLLWSNNISAEYSHLENPKFKRQLDHALGANIPVMVVFGESELQNGTVKVKDMKNHDEKEVKVEDMVAEVMAAGAKQINAGADLELLDALL